MMRVAIAGTGGLAQYIAHYLATGTFHQFILLSRAPKPQLTARGWQVIVVDYTDQNGLRFKLAGVDTVISTVSGNAQLALIDAAASVQVRRFAPAEFEGPPALRPPQVLSPRDKNASLARLQQYAQHPQYGMKYTAFTCGVFYERFAPGGMAASAIGLGSGTSGEGEYLMDVRSMRAKIPYYNAAGEVVHICMTSAEDVGRFVVAALDLPQWPEELRMCGERMSALDVVRTAEHMRGLIPPLRVVLVDAYTLSGQNFERASYAPEALQDALTYARFDQDVEEQLRLYTLIATAESRFDFRDPNLNGLVNIQPVSFAEW
ncbi:MAG: hypothetical protein M1830_000294, partial [Pleopsidium flavum]